MPSRLRSPASTITIDCAACLDAGGSLWVAYDRLEGEPFRAAVFDPEGRWLGDVETSPGGRVWDIGDDYVLGV